MSVHTTEYLHENIRVGGVQGLEDGKGWRRPAWWFNAELEKTLAQPSHYADQIPISVIRSELFGWEAIDGGINVTVELQIPGDHPLSKTPGQEEIRQVTFTMPDLKAVIREDKLIECYLNDRLEELGPETVMNVASRNFATDSFAKVLVDNTIEIMGGGDNMKITGAGVLKWGRVGYIEVSVPETMHDPKTGIAFRPNLLGSTSFDGSVGTRWDRTINNVVCDNTHQWAIANASDKTGSFKIRRTKNFTSRLRDARTALGMLEDAANEFLEIAHQWSEIEVSPKQFVKFLDVIVPVPEVKKVEQEKMVSIQGEMKLVKIPKTNTNSQTIALNKRDAISKLYTEDPRCAPWTGTKFGVAQAMNTWATHEQTMKGAKAYDGNKLQARVEGQLLRVLDGSFADQDEKFLDALDNVLLNFDKEGVMIPVGSDKPVSKPRRQQQSNNN